jgi:hypothetical protein
MRIDYTLTDYIILKIVKDNPNSTPYFVHHKMIDMSMSLAVSNLYYRIHLMLEDKCLECTGTAFLKHGLVKKHKKACREGRLSRLLKITVKGEDRLLQLNAKIHYCLSLQE